MTTRRQHLLLLSTLLAGRPFATRAATPSRQAAMARFDVVYIPALFLTGTAARQAPAVPKAQAAMRRLLAEWPERRAALQALWPRDAGWRHALDTSAQALQAAARDAESGAWEAAHNRLEAVRESQFHARRALGEAYLLDDFTAFHEVMEAITASPTPSAERLQDLFTQARVRWHRLSSQPIAPATWGLTPTREARLQQAMADETSALSRLSDALRGGDAAATARAAAALKAPFVQAYVAFGWEPDERQPLG